MTNVALFLAMDVSRLATSSLCLCIVVGDFTAAHHPNPPSPQQFYCINVHACLSFAMLQLCRDVGALENRAGDSGLQSVKYSYTAVFERSCNKIWLSNCADLEIVDSI